jgi:type II secretory pathway component PulF
MTADSPADGRRQLRDRGLSVERFGQAMTAPTIPRLHALGRSRRDECVADFSRLLALLLRNGVPLDRALQVMIDQARGGWQATLRDIRGSLDAGATLADSLTRHRHWFDDLFLGAIRVGEQTGQLDEALLQASEYLKERQTLSGKITTALVYPVMLSIIGLGVVLFLMTYVVPQLLTVLEGGGQAIPASTRILKSLSDLLLNHWIKLLAVLIGVVLAIALILRTKPGRKRFHRIQLRFPLIGVLLRKTLIARFAQQMSMMLASGIPFVEALRLVRRSARNVILVEELGAMEAAVEAGSDIAPTLSESRIFPPLVAQLLAVGQDAGELTEVLDQLRSGYETEVRLAVARFTAALEPLLIIFMAGVVGFIVFATVMPILQATRSMV